MSKFKVGDKVRAFGCEGVVRVVDKHGLYPIKVRFDKRNNDDCFLLDGSYYHWHKEPSLELIERPKKKVKIEFYRRVKADGSLTEFFYSDCLKRYSPSSINGYEVDRRVGATKYGEPITLETKE